MVCVATVSRKPMRGRFHLMLLVGILYKGSGSGSAIRHLVGVMCRNIKGRGSTKWSLSGSCADASKEDVPPYGACESLV